MKFNCLALMGVFTLSLSAQSAVLNLHDDPSVSLVEEILNAGARQSIRDKVRAETGRL